MRAMSTPSVNDGPGFHSDVPISELTERDTRAIEASVVSLAPPIAETEDGVTHEIWSTPIDPHGARGLSRPIPTQESDRPRFEGQPTMGLRPPRVKQS